MPNTETCINISIERLTGDGWGVGYHQGKITFVPGWLPGERGTAVIRESKKNWQRAEPVVLEEVSSQRIQPPCPVFAVCGGCQLQHLPYEETLRWKRVWLQETLERIGKIQAEIKPVIAMPDSWRYRNKAVLHRQNGQLGYYQERSNTLAAFEDCLLLSEAMNRWIKVMREHLPTTGRIPSAVTLRENQMGRQGLILLEGLPESATAAKVGEAGAWLADLAAALNPSPPEFSVGMWGRSNRGSLKHVYGQRYLTVKIQDMVFEVSPLAFLQVNDLQTEVLYGKILEWAELAGSEEVWDLYCGVGTISLLLSRCAGRVVGFDIHAAAVNDARRNAQANQCGNVEFKEGKVEWEIVGMKTKPEVIVLDPPRAGAHPKVLEKILEVQPRRLIYVSCDPGTLARDLKLLAAGGFAVVKVQPVDMFPWTGQVESMVLLSAL
ncbi:MAG: 23S rRNA (uracil(1939)-C(5))-methyltransferase RlmD [Peptococcaceae bacterium]|jgi:23S rRNA (uracil1939-C5)-methyltransferase|nr:23S rRNA (uracil(1939)-C(5))-methyltransferase RlmD [Peptococcaceae bacterium]